MTTEAHDERVDKIQKLLAKAERASTEEEASAFFAKAEELMTKWAIDDAMLRASGKMEREEITERIIKFASSSYEADYRLVKAIGIVHDLKFLVSKSSKQVYLIGFPSDIEATMSLFLNLKVQADRFALKEEVPAWYTSFEKYVYRRSFKTGFADRIGQRLQEQRRSTVAAEAKTRGSGMELVLVDRRKQVDLYFHDRPKGKGRASRITHDYNGSARGRAAGDRADLGNRRVGGSRKELH